MTFMSLFSCHFAILDIVLESGLQHLESVCLSFQGHIECWDPRTRFRAGMLDCALATYQESNM